MRLADERRKKDEDEAREKKGSRKGGIGEVGSVKAPNKAGASKKAGAVKATGDKAGCRAADVVGIKGGGSRPEVGAAGSATQPRVSTTTNGSGHPPSQEKVQAFSPSSRASATAHCGKACRGADNGGLGQIPGFHLVW
eukprot:jgi/Mesvir1/20660/Mv14876-RA.1